MEKLRDARSENAHKILNLERYKFKLKLKESGLECHEDTKGRFKIWVRLLPSKVVAHP